LPSPRGALAQRSGRGLVRRSTRRRAADHRRPGVRRFGRCRCAGLAGRARGGAL